METMYILASVGIVSLVSLVGVVTLSFKESLLQKSVFLFIGLATGALLGDAILHIIPESLGEAENPTLISTVILVGFLFFFALEKFFHWHHHNHEHAPDHYAHSEDKAKEKIKPLGFMILFSDGIHNLVDGLIIGASYLVSIEVGIATTIAVVLHEIPQEISDFGILIHAGFTKTKALLVNFASALTAFVGAMIPLTFHHIHEDFVPIAVAFAAGNFIYIASSDLVPELHKTTAPKRSTTQFIMILIGISIMYGLLFLHADGHAHGVHEHDTHSEQEVEHNHDIELEHDSHEL